jgi:glycosyltransferase involved in cell wall biosynthesis
VSGIHHFVPVFHRGDAVGRHTLRLRDTTRERGFDSHIYVDVINPATRGETRTVAQYPTDAQRGDVLVYQFATASFMAHWLGRRPETLVVNYHNITPPELVASWDNEFARGQVQAQVELRMLAARTTLAVADSAYNAEHLAEAGFARTAVVPPSAALRDEPGPTAHRSVRPGGAAGVGARWLCVGRVSPNKSIEDTVAALAITRAHMDPEATLLVIGRATSAPYAAALRRYVTQLGLRDAVRFTGHASDATVEEAYLSSDVLVVTSAHEGFCVPVVEAMAADLPVVAFRQGALPEVLGAAGEYIDRRDPYALATTIAGLLADPTRRAEISVAAAERLRALNMATAAPRFVDLLAPLVSGL